MGRELAKWKRMQNGDAKTLTCDKYPLAFCIVCLVSGVCRLDDAKRCQIYTLIQYITIIAFNTSGMHHSEFTSWQHLKSYQEGYSLVRQNAPMATAGRGGQ